MRFQCSSEAVGNILQQSLFLDFAEYLIIASRGISTDILEISKLASEPLISQI